MPRVRIIKKNDEYSSEYDLGDIFEITGTWYGGVHIEGKSGVPVSLDKDALHHTIYKVMFSTVCFVPVLHFYRFLESAGMS